GLLPALVVNLARGASLQELHSKDAAPEVPSSGWTDRLSEFFLWPCRLAALGLVAFMGWRILSQFAELHGSLERLTMSGEILQWWIAWSAFLFCVGAQAFIFGRVVLLSRNALIPLVVGLMVWPLDLSWGFFRADIHHNMAIFFSKSQNWDEALKNYLKVGKLNPAYVMSYYFKGNVFLDRFEMTKVYNPKWGDPPEVARDDYDRALEAYDQVRANAPNYVQMHHQVGILHMKRADWERAHGNAAEADRHLDLALESLRKYHALDPVFAPNYFRMGQVHMLRHQFDKAIEVYRENIEAPACTVAPWMLAKDSWRKTIMAYQVYEQRDGVWKHLHETSEAYLQLSNAYFFKDDLANAAASLKDALRLDPSNAQAAQNLKVVYAKAQSEGRLKILPPAAPGQPPILQIAPK
ncbi:MAG TPA: hypothetical protein VNI01_02875, partial [Elusimicrobiota bacterium]|nr:hypothetical protein [Elusimicrobiota bacterium]